MDAEKLIGSQRENFRNFSYNYVIAEVLVRALFGQRRHAEFTGPRRRSGGAQHSFGVTITILKD